MSRIKEEQQVVEQMVRLYCRKKEGHARSDALGGAENDFVPPRCRHQAYPKRIIAYGLLDYPTQLPIMADYI